MVEVVRAATKGEAHGWEDFTAGVDERMSNEVAALMSLTLEAGVPEGKAVCGPVFAGSQWVAGADADLIVDGCLYDVKTRVDPRKGLPAYLRQLIGYALLDWDDRYGLKSAGFYFARQGKWMSWPLSYLLRQTTGRSSATLLELRKDFRRYAEKHGSRRQHRGSRTR